MYGHCNKQNGNCIYGGFFLKNTDDCIERVDVGGYMTQFFKYLSITTFLRSSGRWRLSYGGRGRNSHRCEAPQTRARNRSF